MTRRLLLLTVLLMTGGAPALAQEVPALRVVNAGPTGEIAALDQANEIRVVFSEPMVALGRIPQPVTAPFFTIRPAVSGTFRWSGTTILIFTPDAKTPLPYATRYDVTIDRSARAASGRSLAAPFMFSFTTPTVKLLAAEWFRRNDRFDGQAVLMLRFNQPVGAADVLAHLDARFIPHAWAVPQLTPAAEARLAKREPAGLARFRAKVAAVDAAAQSTAPLGLRVTDEWNRERWKPSPDLVALETLEPPPPESWLGVTLGTGMPSLQGRVRPPREQSYTVEFEPAFFVRGVGCTAACNPSDYNPIELTVPVTAASIRAAVRVADITNPAKESTVAPGDMPAQSEQWAHASQGFTLEDLRYTRQPPVRTYAVRFDPSLRAEDGQSLGYPWTGVIENWHESAFSSFGDGHGVWESTGGALLPFYARNLRDATQWALPVSPADLMPTIMRLRERRFDVTPDTPGAARRLRVEADRIQSHGLDVTRALNPSGTGIVWASVRDGTPLERSRRAGDPRKSSIVQVTNLGIAVKDSPDNTLIFVTRLDTGEPVAGAGVSIVRPDNAVFWKGTTNNDGIAIAPDTPLRHPLRSWEFSFIVVAEKDGDVAYVGSDWSEGIEPWQFGVHVNLDEQTALLRGTVFTDRGVYRLGEEIHFKAILRADTRRGIVVLPAGTPVHVLLRDGQYRVVDRRTLKTGAWSSAEWTFTLPGEGALGHYTITAQLEDPAVEREKPADRDADESDVDNREWRRVTGSFLVAAYRRPDFRVDVTAAPESDIAGAELRATIAARYLFGAAMANRPVRWKVTRTPIFSAPPAVLDRFLPEQWQFVGHPHSGSHGEQDVAGDRGALDARGEIVVPIATSREQGLPYRYTTEGEVEDVSRQRIANRASQLVHPAPWYIGLRRPPYFAERRAGIDTALVAVDPKGSPVAGVAITVALKQVQWHSVRRSEGGGFYTWDTQRRETDAGSWTVTTALEPVPLSIPLPSGGSFLLTARAEDEAGRSTVTHSSFYALGEGYTAWERFDHNRIELVPERRSYRPGDEARIMIQSPWERATALLTTEREGVRTHRRFTLTSTQQTVSVPIAEADIPNVFVSVLLVKGRTTVEPANDASDPGRPSFRLGYVELQVDDATRRLTTKVTTNRDEYRPAHQARVEVEVRDAAGRPVSSEVTLWAVDYGVLSLTAFQTPDVLRSVYVPKALQVFNSDNRQRIILRRAIVPKGTDDGGGGGQDAGAGTTRRDFRVLAFWVGSTITNAEGKAAVDVTLPESLTTYRIMAVSGDQASRFGSGESEIRVSKPVTLRPAFPRFMAVGDRASFGSVVTNQLREGGEAVVTMRSLDRNVLRIDGAGRKTVRIAAGRSAEVTFNLTARAVGRARIQTTVRLNGQTDAYEDMLPVEVLAAAETVAASGDTNASARETLRLPAGVVSGFGGLRVEMASTAMVGLGEGARYLVEYPYGCAEQKGSRALAMLLASDLGEAFDLPGIDAKDLRPRVQASLRELRTFQCASGGFAFWPGGCPFASPYLTSYLLHVFHAAASLKYEVDEEMRGRAFDYLEGELRQPPPENEGWWPAYTAWQAFAVKVLVDGGRNQDSNITRLFGYADRMPVFALVHLYDAVSAGGGKDIRADEIRRRVDNAIVPEGGSAHVEELSDPYLLWFWNSNVRSTAIVLDALVRRGNADLSRIRPIVRWLMSARERGRWGNTQENAWAMEALVRYYRAYEADVPDFTARATLDGKELARDAFKGRSTNAATREVPMQQLAGRLAAGSEKALTFEKQGSGTLFYATRLRYAVDQLFHDGLDQGFTIDRSYAPFVEDGAARPAATTFEAGDLVRVTLTLRLTKERRYVAVTDPLPAGFEPIESWFASTARELAAAQDNQGEPEERRWRWWWERGGFDHVERHDDRVLLFATRLSEGEHTFSYIARATTPGTFRTAPAHAEEMYEPEVFGRTAAAVVEVRP